MAKIMRIFSFERIVALAGAAVWRFPVGVTAALVATVCGAIAVGHTTDLAATLEVIGLVAVLVMVWSVAMTLAVEWRGVRWAWGASLLVVLCGVLYYTSVPRMMDDFLLIHGLRTGLLIFAGLLFLCVAPFVTARDDRRLWFFVMETCERFAFAVIVTATFYAGIAAALASVHYLFGVNVEWEWYVRVWIAMAGFVAPLIFMAGIPRMDALQDAQTRTAPRVVRIFAQYVLVPLLVLYIVILYAYGAKILFTRTWPQGGVGYMVLIFASMGLVTTLVLAVDRATRQWVSVVSRTFFALLVPTLALLGGAIFIRIADYGWTPSRYSVVLLGLWFFGLSIYALVRKHTDLRVPFVTLAVLIILSIYGPWSMFATSVRSQVTHLTELVDRESIRVQGVIARPTDVRELPWGRFNAIQSRVQVLASLDALDQIAPWFAADNQPENARDDNEGRRSNTSYARTSRTIAAMGIKSGPYYDNRESSTIFYSATVDDASQSITVTGYDYYIPYVSVHRDGDAATPATFFSHDDYLFTLTQDAHIAVKRHSDDVVVATSEVLSPVVEKIVRARTDDVTPSAALDPIRLHGTAGTFDCTVQNMEINTNDSTPRITSLSLSCLVANATR